MSDEFSLLSGISGVFFEYINNVKQAGISIHDFEENKNERFFLNGTYFEIYKKKIVSHCSSSTLKYSVSLASCDNLLRKFLRKNDIRGDSFDFFFSERMRASRRKLKKKKKILRQRIKEFFPHFLLNPLKERKKAISNRKPLCLYWAIKPICGKFLFTFSVIFKMGMNLIWPVWNLIASDISHGKLLSVYTTRLIF